VNGLLEAIVFAARTAEDVCTIYPAAAAMPPPDAISDSADSSLFGESAAIARMREVMSQNIGPVRNHEGLASALKEIAVLEREGGASHGFRNMITAARLIAYSALLRTESRGTHRRSDFPDSDPLQERRSVFTLGAVEMGLQAALDSDAMAYA
jgi:L-aspartate oxidase